MAWHVVQQLMGSFSNSAEYKRYAGKLPDEKLNEKLNKKQMLKRMATAMEEWCPRELGLALGLSSEKVERIIEKAKDECKQR